MIQTDSTSGCGDEFERLKNRTNIIHAKAWLFIPDYLVAQFPLERGDASVLIDGAEVPLYAVDYALSGVLAAAGDHDVRFFFQPRSFRIGAILSGISVLIVATLFLLGRKERLLI